MGTRGNVLAYVVLLFIVVLSCDVPSGYVNGGVCSEVGAVSVGSCSAGPDADVIE